MNASSSKKEITLDDSEYYLPPQGIELDKRNDLIEKFRKYIDTQKENFLGYQANQDIEFRTETAGFLDYHVNNIGDPFTNGNFTINSKIMEKAVLDYYAKLWHAKLRNENDPQDPESYWGYVLSMGSSEGKHIRTLECAGLSCRPSATGRFRPEKTRSYQLP